MDEFTIDRGLTIGYGLTVTRGLPGCGKTTCTRDLIAAAPPGSVVRLNRDDYRLMMFGGWTGDGRHEDRVTAAQVAAARDLLRGGIDVICDDTNLPDAAMVRWRAIADEVGCDLTVWDLRGVDLAVCLANNNRRIGTAAYVSPIVINDMWDTHIAPYLASIEGSTEQ